ncbi:mandelate racemase/muconate lactonizing enzyme family protein [Maribacter chungangensis]|uniref:Dipeptide epimerase n=1 Tax=Maribacter chungangensis TaxID=1069117 RepID=A0ABW3B0P6_9FLAO
MRITKISYERIDLKLAVPYTIAYETIDRTTNFILKIETNGKWVGYGCAAPDPVVTGEAPKDVERAIENEITDYLIGKNPFTYALLLMELKQRLGKRASSLAMVDLALFDLISKKAEVPLYKFLGGYRTSIPTSITIGILSLEETMKHAKEYVYQGFSILKIKGGSDLEEDVAKMNALHSMYPNVTWRFDGNQGYSVSDSISFIKETEAIDLEMLEQPTIVGAEEHLGQVTNKVTTPVMADESLKTLADAFRLAQHKRINMVNIKLQKVGGIMVGMHINSVAKSANLQAMVGCIDECGLGIAAGLHFALSRPNIMYADLDGHLELVNDPYKDIFTLQNGILFPTEKYGLGYDG